MHIASEKDALAVNLEAARESNKVLEAQLSVVETECKAVHEEKRAGSDQFTYQVTYVNQIRHTEQKK